MCIVQELSVVVFLFIAGLWLSSWSDDRKWEVGDVKTGREEFIVV